MRCTEKVLLVEAAWDLILPADRASSPPLPHVHTHVYTPAAAGPGLTQEVQFLIGRLLLEKLVNSCDKDMFCTLCVYCTTEFTLHLG